MTCTRWGLVKGGVVAMALLVQGTRVDAQPTQPGFVDTPTDTAGDTDTVGDIVVTARRRAEQAIDVPVSVAVFSGSDLAARGATDFRSLQNSVPNLGIADFANTNKASLVIRGITSNTRNAGFEAGASFYVDGIFSGRPEGTNIELVDIQSLEVLRGPQGTVFGKNSIAGAINITTGDPVDVIEGRLTGEVGNFSYYKLTGMLNLPVTNGFDVRVTGYRKKRDGYIRNVVNGREYANDDSYGGRIKARLELSDSVDVIFGADYFKEDRLPPFGENLRGVAPLIPGNPVVAPGPRTIAANREPQETREGFGGSVTVNAKLGSGGTLSSITAIRGFRYTFGTDQDNSAADLIFTDDYDRQRQFSQELRYVSPSGKRLEYVIGLFYFNQRLDTRHVGGIGSDFAIPLTDATGNIVLGPGNVPVFILPPGAPGRVIPNGRVTTESYAAYIDTTFQITPKLALLAGIRYTSELKDTSFGIIAEPRASVLFIDFPRAFDTQSASDLSPTIGLRYTFSRQAVAYAKVARGFKSGGWNLDFIGRSPAPPPTIQQLQFRPENVNNYEIGLKLNLAGGRFRLNTAAFWMDYRNLQVSQFFGLAGGRVTNAANATIKGIEADFTAIPFKGLTLNGGIGLLDPKYDDFANVNAAGASAAGKRLQNTAKITGTLGAQYEFAVAPLGGSLTLRGDVNYRGDTFDEPLNDPRFRTPPFALVNARLSYTPDKGNWDLAIWAENLLDKQYLLGVQSDPFAPNEAQGSFGRPRTFGASVSYKF